MGVPRHLQVPLSIDTSISYSLDKSMFPGLDDPRYKYEPVLMIATEASQSSPWMTFGKVTSFNGHHSYVSVDLPSADDLHGIMDFNADDLLPGLENTQEYLSLVEDVIKELPHGDELQYLEGPQKDLANRTKCTQHQRVSFSDRLCGSKCSSGTPGVPNGYPAPRTTLQRTSNSSGHSYRNDQSLVVFNNTDSVTSSGDDTSKGYSSHVSCVANPVFGKRKRTDSCHGSSYQKKPCYSKEFVNYISIHQSSWNNCGFVFSGSRNGNQIRVM